jgi:MarR family transcriptional regulator, organic hydroperoxide resistance regulator
MSRISTPATRERATGQRAGTQRAGNQRANGRKAVLPASLRAAAPPSYLSSSHEPDDSFSIDTLSELQRAANAVRQHVEQSVLRREHLTWTGFVVLRTVLHARRIETRHAAAEAGIAKATLTGVVDTLVGRGLVRRLDHPDDRRLVLLELTRSGHRLVRKLIPAVRGEEAFALAELELDQLNQVTWLLRRLIEHLDTDEARLRRG